MKALPNGMAWNWRSVMDEHDVRRAILIDKIDRELMRSQIVGEAMTGIGNFMMWFYGGLLACLILIGLIVGPLEAIGEHNCKKMLQEAGVTEPANWPNCGNMEGQEIMKARYGD